MRCYHFLNEEFGLKDLRERRLKISRIMELNDPFEFLGADLSDRDFRKAMKTTKKSLSESKGILCFSKCWQNPVQWAHYADRHKGICLGFDVPEENLSRINYVQERLRINPTITDNIMLEMLTTKFSHWEYEQEYRAFLSLSEADNGIYYANFSESLELKQIMIGTHSSVTRAQINLALNNQTESIEIFKVRAAFRKFQIVRNQNEKLWG